MGDHTETLEIDYDPSQISYEEILNIFWNSHSPYRRSWRRQYMSAIFYHNETQKKIALRTKTEQEAKTGRTIHTEIAPLTHFYWAEDYHQKYALRRHRAIAKELTTVYPTNEAFVNSTAAARINGYLSGYGSRAMVDAELEQLGLSAKSQNKVRRTVYEYHEE